jgi:hypothetical protein
VHGVIFLGDCVITASHDRTIKVLLLTTALLPGLFNCCFQLWDCRRRTCITTVTTGSRGVYGMAVVGNELVTSVGNSLCAWDLRQLSAGAFDSSSFQTFDVMALSISLSSFAHFGYATLMLFQALQPTASRASTLRWNPSQARATAS